MKERILPALCVSVLLLFSACQRPPEAMFPATEPTAPAAEPYPSTAETVPEPVPEPAAEAPSFVEELAMERTQALGETEGEPAVRAAYRWLVGNIYFADPVGLDTWRYLSDETEAIPYLENRALSPLLFGIGSCEDFAAAMVLLLRAQGFEAEYVAGYTLSVEQIYVDHAWAIVRLNGRWHHLDPQLEQNVIRKSNMAYRYYLRSDEEMAVDHKWGENLINYWSDMPEAEKEAIRRNYTPPACPESGPTPEPETLPPPLMPNGTEVEARIADIVARSGKGRLLPLCLNVEPPVLVEALHVTPLLLPDQGKPEPAGYRRGLLEGEQAALYDALIEAAERYPDTARVSLADGVTGAEAQAAVDAFLVDRPEYYWLQVALPEEGGSRELRLTGTIAAGEIERRRVRVEAEAERLLMGLDSASDFEKVLYIHDYLAGQVHYDRETTRRNGGNLYGALVERIAYCDGYAGAFQYLSGKAGVETAYLTGRSLRGVAHAWNAVRLDGQWHYVDVTWDRPLRAADDVYHDYFLIGEAEMRMDRRPDDESTLPPPRADGAPGYYERMGYAVGDGQEDPAGALASVFLRQLKAEETFPRSPEPVFLELKVLGDGETYRLWKEHYVKQVFDVLRVMEDSAREEGLPFTISGDESVRCDFNDTMQVLTFYPKVSLLQTAG